MRSHRYFRFSLRSVLVVVVMLSIAFAYGPMIWNSRITAPRRIDVLGTGVLSLANSTIYFPIERESVHSFYVYDGGTYGVRFLDARGVEHIVGSWHPLGEPDHHGDLIVGGTTPASAEGGVNLGRIAVGEQLIYSVMELEDQSHQERPTIIDTAYPRTRDYFVDALPTRIRYWFGIGQ